MLKKPVSGLNGREVYFEGDTNDAKGKKHTFLVSAENIDSAYVAVIYTDSLIITGYDPMTNEPGGKKRSLRSCSLLFKHIQSFSKDTIIISDLSFTQYRNTRTLSGTYSWKHLQDTVMRAKSLHITRASSKSFPESIPPPHIAVSGINARDYLRLMRKVQTTVAYYCSPPKYNYNFVCEQIDFTFVLDLAEIKLK